MVDIYIVVYKFYRVYIHKLYEFCMRYSTKRKKKEYGKPKIDKEKVWEGEHKERVAKNVFDCVYVF